MKDLLKTFFDVLKNERIQLKEFAENNGLSLNKLYQWKNNRSQPNKEDVIKIRAYLNGKVINELPNNLKDGVPEYFNGDKIISEGNLKRKVMKSNHPIINILLHRRELLQSKVDEIDEMIKQISGLDNT